MNNVVILEVCWVCYMPN
uniref:Uncharacterized protein n=1 Tax=Anguilla anguilla TaxID=7936 RepID=A0A0E9TFC1_ANGAN